MAEPLASQESRTDSSKRDRFEHLTLVPAPPGEVFAWHERPEAIDDLVPPWEPVEVIQPPASLQVGTQVILKMSLGPISINWVAEHTEYDPPCLFADRQLRGPFASWYHRHYFDDHPSGGTLMRDVIDYQVPMGWLGRRLGHRVVESKLRRMFAYRHQQVLQAFTQT